MKFLNALLELVFPTKCISCGEAGTDFCSWCLSQSRPAERESAEWIFPLYDYRHPPIKKALWLFKYKGKKYAVPGVLLSGNHKKIAAWRQKRANLR